MKDKIPFGLLLLAIWVKFSWFYNVTKVNNHYFAVVLITFVLYSGIILLLSKKPWLAITVASVLTFVFECEVVYFRYFNKLLSFNNLTQARFVNSVTGVMLNLIRPVDVILLLDLLVLALIVFKKKDYLHVRSKHKWITLSMMLVIIPCLTLASFGNEFATSILNQEFFLYHTKDGIEVYHSETLASDEVVVEPEPIVLEDEPVEVIKYHGLFKGKNVITIQVESLQDMMLHKMYNGQEITPFLNKLALEDSFYFSSYYQQLGRGNTSDAEFSSHNSLYPCMDDISYNRYQKTNFRGLPVLLSDLGYETMAFHGNEASFWCREEAYANQGFQYFYSEEALELDEIIGMGLYDESLYRQGVEILKSQNEPFYAFFVTITNHNPYELPEEKITIDLLEEDQDTMFGHYIESVRNTDDTIRNFYRMLESEGLLDDTVLIIYGDHHGMPCMDDMYKTRITDFLGYEYDFDEMMNVPMIIHGPGMGFNYVDDNTFDQQDMLPTLVNLMALDSNQAMMGQDMLNTKDYFALFQTYMVKGSFIWGDTVFEMSRDGIFENSRAWDRRSKQPIDVKDCVKGYERALYEIALSKYLLENNMIEKKEAE